MNGRAAGLVSSALGCALSALSPSCIDTAQDRVSVPLEIAGTAVGPIQSRAGFVVELERAELAFGPLYLCAGALAGDNCESARLEWLDSVVVDALEPTPVRAGELSGVSGEVRSAMYDFGIASLLTAPLPVELASAVALGGNSVRLAGTAARDGVDGEVLDFELEMPIAQGESAEQGVPIVRISGNGELVHAVTGAEHALRVRFDPTPWLREVDFESVLREAAAGEVESLGPGGQAERAVRTALITGERPRFEWITFP